MPNTAIKYSYSLFCCWQLASELFENKINSKYLRQVHDINKVRAKPAFQN